MILKTKHILAGLAALLTIGTTGVGTAMANTSTIVTVKHNAYLITAPKTGSTRIAIEKTSTKLTVIAGSNKYWWHVLDSSGRKGYITTNTYYTSQSIPKSSITTTSTPKSLSVPKVTLPPSASTNSSVVEVLHNAYMVSAPKSGSTKIKLEQTGTQLTIESGGNTYWWHVKDASGLEGYMTTNSYYTKETTRQNVQLPQGVTLDPAFTPIAPVSATPKEKFDAILQVAQSKLGTPYVWGHNEDRGQTGFDCSNFAAYVYHHALGYIISTSSVTQYKSVGTTVSVSDMQPGDLLTFNDGGHSGIYIGNNQMIQCGGGLGKVGYLSVAPGSYWYNHLSAVKRMF
jgi:cell wall-associated NlpC family hydrolase